MSADSSREFENNFPDYVSGMSEHFLNNSSNAVRLESSLEEQIKDKVRNLVSRLEEGYSINWKDSSVYTGTAGVALMYYHLYKHFDDDKNQKYYLFKSVELIKKTLKNLNHRTLTFLCGDAGPLAIASVVFKTDGQHDESDKCLKKLNELYAKMNSYDDLPDEMLYGKAGILFAFLFVRHHLGPHAIDNDIISSIAKSIIKDGRQLAKGENSGPPLMYEWHSKKYFGAAHGLMGILYMLMTVKDDQYVASHLQDLIKPTIDYMLSLKLPSGNYPSSMNSKSDQLVQWCHGAPGWIPTFLAAYEIFGEEDYLNAAKGCAKVTWKRGLLRKGYGICHGTAGNAYGFLAVFRATKQSKYLYYAIKYAEWCLEYGNHGCRIADRPFSLFEGMAGTIYFLVDILKPSHAMFPAYEL